MTDGFQNWGEILQGHHVVLAIADGLQIALLILVLLLLLEKRARK